MRRPTAQNRREESFGSSAEASSSASSTTPACSTSSSSSWCRSRSARGTAPSAAGSRRRISLPRREADRPAPDGHARRTSLGGRGPLAHGSPATAGAGRRAPAAELHLLVRLAVRVDVSARAPTSAATSSPYGRAPRARGRAARAIGFLAELLRLCAPLLHAPSGGAACRRAPRQPDDGPDHGDSAITIQTPRSHSRLLP